MGANDQSDVTSLVNNWKGPKAQMASDAKSVLENDTARLVAHVYDRCSAISKHSGKTVDRDTLEVFVASHDLSVVRIHPRLVSGLTRKAEIWESAMRHSFVDFGWLTQGLGEVIDFRNRLDEETLNLADGVASPTFPPDRIRELIHVTIEDRMEVENEFFSGTSALMNFSHTRLFASALHVALVDMIDRLLEIRHHVERIQENLAPSSIFVNVKPAYQARFFISRSILGKACKYLPYPLDFLD